MNTDSFSDDGGAVEDGAPGVTEQVTSAGELPPFFAVSILKLAVMSFVTVGLYEIYWFYRNWQRIRVCQQRDIKPSLRAFFGLVFCYPCFSEIRKTGLRMGVGSPPPTGLLAVGWTVMCLVSELPAPLWLIALFHWVFVVPVQVYVNRVNQEAAPGHDRNSRFTVWNWVGICVGAVAILLNLMALWRMKRVG